MLHLRWPNEIYRYLIFGLFQLQFLYLVEFGWEQNKKYNAPKNVKKRILIKNLLDIRVFDQKFGWLIFS